MELVEADRHACLNSDAVDTSTAEAMVAEALCMVDEAHIVSDSLTSVLAHGKLGQSSLQLSSVLQMTGQTAPRPRHWRQRGVRQRSTLPCRCY